MGSQKFVLLCMNLILFCFLGWHFEANFEVKLCLQNMWWQGPETRESLELGFQHGSIKKNYLCLCRTGNVKKWLLCKMSICVGLLTSKKNQMSSVLCLTISEDQPNTREGDSVLPYDFTDRALLVPYYLFCP